MNEDEEDNPYEAARPQARDDDLGPSVEEIDAAVRRVSAVNKASDSEFAPPFSRKECLQLLHKPQKHALDLSLTLLYLSLIRCCLAPYKYVTKHQNLLSACIIYMSYHSTHV